MGVVYKAHDPKINRLVAIKTITLHCPDSAEERDYRARFFREAEAAGRLSHPRIVTIFDVAEDPDTQTPYIVMEYVPGHSLEEVLSTGNGRLPLGDALQVTQELAEALGYAHAQRIVHRDVKPSNIIVAEDGHSKIADFGIAKLNAADLAQARWTVGTPAYMSPEQLRGDPVDGRSDLFSLGVILYRLLTGHRPFQGNSVFTISFKVVNRDPVPATAFNAELSPELDHVIARAIAKNPSQRYQTGMEMALDLQDLRGGIAPRSSNGASLAGHEKEQPASLDRLFPQRSLAGSVGATIMIGSSREKSSSPSNAEVATVQFSQPWQQVSIAFLTLGFLAVAFAGLWRAIPVKATHSTATAYDLPASRPNATVAPSALAHTVPKRARQAPQQVLSSTLRIAVEHHFGAAYLSVWIDGRLTYRYPLRGTIKKRMLLFKGVQGYFSDLVQVAGGEHLIHVRILSADSSYDESGSIRGIFVPGVEKVLTIEFDKNNRGMHLSLQ